MHSIIGHIYTKWTLFAIMYQDSTILIQKHILILQKLKNAVKAQKQTFATEVERAYKIFIKYGFIAALNYINDKTTAIVGDGANFGNKIKNDDGKRIIYNHQPSYMRTSFTMKIQEG